MIEPQQARAEMSRLRETMRLLRLAHGLLSDAYAIEQHACPELKGGSEYGQRVFDVIKPVSELLRVLEQRMGELGRIVQGKQP